MESAGWQLKILVAPFFEYDDVSLKNKDNLVNVAFQRTVLTSPRFSLWPQVEPITEDAGIVISACQCLALFKTLQVFLKNYY